MKRFLLSTLAYLMLAFASQGQAPGDEEFSLYTFPNASLPGTIVELQDIRGQLAEQCRAYLNGIEMAVVERLSHSIRVLVPNTHSGFPVVEVGDVELGTSINQLFVLSPNILFEHWVPVPITEDTAIVGTLHPPYQDSYVLELYEGDVVSFDLVSIDPTTWYPYDVWEPCRIGMWVWPTNFWFMNTTFSGPRSFIVEEDGIYIFHIRPLCNYPYMYLFNIRIN